MQTDQHTENRINLSIMETEIGYLGWAHLLSLCRRRIRTMMMTGPKEEGVCLGTFGKALFVSDRLFDLSSTAGSVSPRFKEWFRIITGFSRKSGLPLTSMKGEG